MSLFSRLVVLTLPLIPRAIVGRIARTYVAGETQEDALRVAEDLCAQGAMATLDLLGEEVSQRKKAEKAVEEYIRLFEAINVLGKPGFEANVSIKLTLLGLKIGEHICRDNVERIALAAKNYGNFVRLDMEDRSTTDATLRIYQDLQAKHENLGVVLQAYMRRTLGDIDDLPAVGANVRLCKGIYIEPREVAWKGYDTVRRNYLAALEKLVRKGVYVGIATHDEYLVCGATEILDRYSVAKECYEFQMLLGVDEELRRAILGGGHRLRVYIPYGRDWYQYSVRRLRENPEVARHVIRAMFGLR